MVRSTVSAPRYQVMPTTQGEAPSSSSFKLTGACLASLKIGTAWKLRANSWAETSPAHDSDSLMILMIQKKTQKSLCRHWISSLHQHRSSISRLSRPSSSSLLCKRTSPPNSPGRTRRCRSALLSGSTSTHPQSLRSPTGCWRHGDLSDLTDVLKQQQNAEKKKSFPTFRGTYGIYGTWITLFWGYCIGGPSCMGTTGSPIILQISQPSHAEPSFCHEN